MVLINVSECAFVYGWTRDLSVSRDMWNKWYILSIKMWTNEYKYDLKYEFL